jgi:hypothetical protein
VSGSLKIEDVLKIKNDHSLYSDIEVFIETGTNRGNTIINMYGSFKKLYTIEIKKELYDAAMNRFSQSENVELYLGDSVEVLPELLKKVEESAVFFLDGHWSHEDTGRGKTDTPLLDELTIINRLHNKNSIIIIDDYYMFGTNRNEDWSAITVENILDCFEKGRIFKSYIENDHLILLLTKI